MRPSLNLDPWLGRHNTSDRRAALVKGKTYRDLSTICVVPTRGQIAARVVQAWMNLYPPMNQKFFRCFITGMEVAEAYNHAVALILTHPELSTWPYLLTLEEDNLPPPDGLLRLYESIGPYDVVGGLYWTKGEEGQPMIYGDPAVFPLNFIPQVPQPETVQACRGLGMGFNLYKLSLFKDERLGKAHQGADGQLVIDRPWFKTLQSYAPGGGIKSYTQDLYFYENAGRLGYRFACDTRVKVGHYDVQHDIIW